MFIYVYSVTHLLCSLVLLASKIYFLGSFSFLNTSFFEYFFSSLEIFIYLFVCLFLAALGLCCCVQTFSSCGERGLIFVAVRGLLIAVASLCCRAWTGSRCMGFSTCGTQAQQLWVTGLVASWHVGSSWTRAQTRVSCILNPLQVDS